MHSSQITGIAMGGFFIGLLILVVGLVLRIILAIVSFLTKEEYPGLKKIFGRIALFGAIVTAVSFGTCSATLR